MVAAPGKPDVRAVDDSTEASRVHRRIPYGLNVGMISEVGMGGDSGTTTLWRPTGPDELDLVRSSGWRCWPARLPDQPIFYPVLNEDYAIKIARDWNVPSSGMGYVTRFQVESDFVARYPVRQVGGDTILELWVPAEELDEFNKHIVGLIEVVHEFR